MAEPETTQTPRTDPTGEEAARVAAAAQGSEEPTVIVDDPEETGMPEGEETVTGPAADPGPDVIVDDPEEAAEGSTSGEFTTAPASADLGQALGLGDLTRSELERLQMAVEGELRSKGSEPEQRGPTLSEKASKLPVNEDATKALSAEAAVSPFDGVDSADVITWTVRQDTDAEGNPVGPAYLRIVTRDGQKLTAVHE